MLYEVITIINALSAGTVVAGDVWVVCDSSSAFPAGICDQKFTIDFNGDDALALKCNGLS